MWYFGTVLALCPLPRSDFDARNPSLARFDKKTKDSEGRRMGGYSVIASRFVDEQLREMARGRSREDAYERARTIVLSEGTSITAAARLPGSLMSDVTDHPLLALPPSQIMQGVLEEQLGLLRGSIRVSGDGRKRRAKMHYRTFRDDETNRLIQQRELGGDGQWAVLRKAALEARERRIEAAEAAGRGDEEDPGVITDDELAAYELSDGTLATAMWGDLAEDRDMTEPEAAALQEYKSKHNLGMLSGREAITRLAERAVQAGGSPAAIAAEVASLGVDPESEMGLELCEVVADRIEALPKMGAGWKRRIRALGPDAAKPVRVASGRDLADDDDLAAFSRPDSDEDSDGPVVHTRTMSLEEYEATHPGAFRENTRLPAPESTPRSTEEQLRDVEWIAGQYVSDDSTSEESGDEADAEGGMAGDSKSAPSRSQDRDTEAKAIAEAEAAWSKELVELRKLQEAYEAAADDSGSDVRSVPRFRPVEEDSDN